MYTFCLRKNATKKVQNIDGRQAKQGKADARALDLADMGKTK